MHTDGSPRREVLSWTAGEVSRTGAEIYTLIEDLFPLRRSLTGDGVRQTLDVIEQHIPLVRTEVPTGTTVFDWTLPKEWNVREAWIREPNGRRIVDIDNSSLHVLGYSTPVHEQLELSELREHLFSLPDQPELIPFRNSYYEESWGFCLPHDQLVGLAEGEYEVLIDSTLEDGFVTCAECVLPGLSSDEVLITTNICHPALANDNLSGIGVATALAKYLGDFPLRYTYRFIFSPGTLGPLIWLWRNEARLPKIKAGLVLTCLGDTTGFNYKRSRSAVSLIDRAAAIALSSSGEEHSIKSFEPWGGDERQLCSPGFDLPVGVLTRSPPGTFAEYHTSADDLDFVKPEMLGASWKLCLSIAHILETDSAYRSRMQKGEPQLGRRGLGTAAADRGIDHRALLWILNLSDGRHSILDIAERSGQPYEALLAATELLVEAGLLEPV